MYDFVHFLVQVAPTLLSTVDAEPEYIRVSKEAPMRRQLEYLQILPLAVPFMASVSLRNSLKSESNALRNKARCELVEKQ